MTKEEAKRLSEILKSAADGKLIQYKANNEESWKDLPLDTWIQINIKVYEFRIKPEPKYRPYANAGEFLKAQKEHGPYINTESFLSLELYTIPYSVNDLRVYWSSGSNSLCSNWVALSRLKWQDGTPCGILEE